MVRTGGVGVAVYGTRQGGWATAGLLSLLAAGALLAPAAMADERPPVQSLYEMRHQDVIVQKFDLSCGAAALATVLKYQFGDNVTERDVAGGLIRRKEYIEHPEVIRIRQGFSLLDMKRYVDGRGYKGIGYGKLEMKDLLRLAPIIVAVSPIGYNHFVVFRGRVGDKVLLVDPAFGNRTMSIDKFERIWIDFPQFGRVGFVVTRDGTPAPPGRLAARSELFIAPAPALVRQTMPF